MDGRVKGFDTASKDLWRLSDVAHIARISIGLIERRAYLIGNPASRTMAAVPPEP